MRVDQYSEYLTSVHGKKNQAGDPNVATCIDCHGTHGIRAAADAQSPVYATNVVATCGKCHSDAKRMKSYDIRTDQQEEYSRSVHGDALMQRRDLSAPTCNDCHGNHGAAPPGISSVVNVCGQCHPVNTELFNKSPHSKIFVQMGIPGCATCHSNHEIVETSDAMLKAGDKSACVTCHSPTSSGAKLAASMLVSIDRLKNGYEKAYTLLNNAEHAGMEVSQPLFELNEAKTSLIKARAAIHGFDQALLDKEVEPGLKVSEKAYARGLKALDELQFRRKGLAISALIIFALVVGLILKIRLMERKPK
jgi:hypothetical protein